MWGASLREREPQKKRGGKRRRRRHRKKEMVGWRAEGGGLGEWEGSYEACCCATLKTLAWGGWENGNFWGEEEGKDIGIFIFW